MSHNAVKIIVHREGFVSKFIARTEQPQGRRRKR